MLKKRLVGVVTVKDGWAVQSIGYKRYLPLGKPECLVENLDRWGADEILVQVIDRSHYGQSPDIELLARVASIGLKTPLIYGGGIKSVEDGVQVILSGADRLFVDAVLHDDPTIVKELSDKLGAQAIIASLPLAWRSSTRLEWLDYRTGHSSEISPEVLSLIKDGVVSEVFLIDWLHEGHRRGFEMRIVEYFPDKNVPLIVFGGISETSLAAELFQLENVNSVAVGNFLSYQEHAVQKFKGALETLPLRSPVFEIKHSCFAND